jgi:ribonuclease HI
VVERQEEGHALPV